MAYLQWDHDFCLTCDQQTDGDAYCSETCRMIDYEQAARNSPAPSSTRYPPEGTVSYLWKDAAPSRYDCRMFSTTRAASTNWYMPHYDYDVPPSYAWAPRYTGNGYQGSSPSSTPAPLATPAPKTSSSSATSAVASVLGRSGGASTAAPTTSVTYAHALSPSSSHSSLSSMQSGVSNAGGARSSTTGYGGALDALSAFAYGSMRGSSYGQRANSASNNLSAQARSELRKYASSLEQGKLQRDLQRRRSC